MKAKLLSLVHGASYGDLVRALAHMAKLFPVDFQLALLGHNNPLSMEDVHKIKNADIDGIVDKILWPMVENHYQEFESYFLVETEYEVPNTDGYKVRFSREELAELQQYGAHQKVTCIKRVREMTNLGLKEAKDLVETYFLPQLRVTSY